MARPVSFIAGGLTPSSNVGPQQPFIEFDSTVELVTDFSGNVSSHPVEKGARVTDHFTRENPVFTVRGVTSNTPVLGTDEANVVGSTGKRTKNTYEALKGMYLNAHVFTMISDLDSYPNCIIKNFGFTQNAQQAEALYVDLEIEQLRIVSSARAVALVPVQASKADDSAPKVNRGVTSGKEASEDDLPLIFRRD